MPTKQAPPDGMQYDETTHQWLPAAPVPAEPTEPTEPASPSAKEKQS